MTKESKEPPTTTTTTTTSSRSESNNGIPEPPAYLHSTDSFILHVVEERIQGYHNNDNDDNHNNVDNNHEVEVRDSKLQEKEAPGAMVKTSSHIHAVAADHQDNDNDDDRDHSESTMGHLDSLTLEKLVLARMGRPPTDQDQIQVEAKDPPCVEKISHCAYLTEEQQRAKAEAAAATTAAASVLSVPGAHMVMTKDSRPAAASGHRETPEQGQAGEASPKRSAVGLLQERIRSALFVQPRPGAYQDAPGTGLVRSAEPRFSLLGREQLDPSWERMRMELSTELSVELGVPVQVGRPECPTSSALTVATPVGDGSSMFSMPLPVAEEYGEEQQQESKSPRRDRSKAPSQKIKKLGIALAVALIMITGIVLLVVFLVVVKDDDNQDPSMSDAGVMPAISPTIPPREYVMQLLPASTVREINLHGNGSTIPQELALQWILEDPHGPESYPPERIQQRFALATLYYATNGDNWNNNTDWLDYDSHECSWYSRHWFEDVELYMASSTAKTFQLMYDSRTYPCSQNTTGGDFEHLWLYRNGLEGTLPFAELAMLTSLKSMSLFENGGLEITLTSELGLFPKLEGIEVSSLGVEGSIPTEIGLLTNLQVILGSSNHITGTIPTEYGLLTSMVYSMLSENLISGTLPSELGGMSALEWFYLYNNQAFGTIPTEFLVSRSTTMKLFNMYNNQFSGTLPTEIGLLTNMNLMALSGNQFTGHLPTELGHLTQLKQGLSLGENHFEGTIPTEFGNFRNITGVITGSGTYGLGLSGNQLTGQVPSELGMLSVLERIFLQDNLLTGFLPSELANMTALKSFEAQNNNFTGPAVLNQLLAIEANQNASLLVKWDVTGNPFLSGAVPDHLCGIWKFECSSLLCGCNCTCPVV